MKALQSIIKPLPQWLILGLLLILQSAQAEIRVTYYVPGPDGSPIAATDEQGNVKWVKHYRSFGEEIEQGPAYRHNRISYTGHVKDRGTGLVYMGARYYNPVIGRIYGVDPAAVIPGDPRTFNRYAYAHNNPYRYIDPDGRWLEDVFIGIPSVGIGVYSLYNNVKDGNYTAAGVDVAGIGVDVGAIFAPAVPGGAGLAIKASREGAKKATKSATELSKSAQKGIRSLEKRVVEHEKKLADFKANPTVRPGMEGQPESVIKAAQESRIRHLEKEIQTFKENIEKLKGGQ
jgi:RHS repeat-associated protein